ncbi:hypothetical protein BGW38_007549 [Lunasporangiospora selenospora]|uniref:Uncharacterized protein n=1 Tax=Lunasporangiospora selenospora TaxID=979761 RepID=A0A9P6G5L6_9FUNG|nr:hypothetical protein BGW38_007549 [Lunasporangiospora selenospora]
MPLSVPEECLWLIVDNLRHDRATLHSLLLVNSTMFRIAATSLYESPFRLLQEEPNWNWSPVDLSKRCEALLHLLLHSSALMPQDIKLTSPEYNSIVATAAGAAKVLRRPAGSGDGDNSAVVPLLPRYGPEIDSLPSPSTVDYLSYYTEMHHDPVLHGCFMALFPSIPNCYNADVVWFRSMVEFRNRIENAMLRRLAPQLTSLTIALPMQVPRLQLPFLSNLRRIEVLGTAYGLLTNKELVDLGKDMIASGRSPGLTPRMVVTRLDRLLTFILDHRRLYGTLKELKIEDKPVLLPGRIDRRLVELIEAMGDELEYLDVQHWPEAVLYMDTIPTKNLKSLLLHREKEPAPVFTESNTMARFLSNCRKLEEIRLYTREEDLLKAWRDDRQTKKSAPPDILWNRSFQGLEPLHRLEDTLSERKNLKRLEIEGLAESVITITNEAVELFSRDLEAITVRSWFNGILTRVPLSWSGIDRLERLVSLNLEGEVAWTFDFASLQKCPRLCYVRLAFTAPMPSRSQKKQPVINMLTRVLTLKELVLVGKWETLNNRGWPWVIRELYQLERLDLQRCEGITAEQVVELVQDVLGWSERWRLKRREEAKAGRCSEFWEQSFYGHSRLAWVIVNKGLRDAIERLWDGYERRLQEDPRLSSPTLAASFRRVRFGYVCYVWSK